ncbi:hypothetical protein GCM10010145_54390 [Streptomyces ruber]|uniref:DUF397 domain-containing protein n=2 Tax=Streptomyces TaxID=1883 RepID=A0A918EVB2_9ACTN|nr:DUF397 domain-containing protein [Streptomyces ruber]GGQ77757.1 hypothetical protein GCM10010145_54390 [Streptomyces ruber]
MSQNAWQKSSFSGGGDSDECVELAAVQGSVRLRESDDPGTVLTATVPELAALIRHLRDGR